MDLRAIYLAVDESFNEFVAEWTVRSHWECDLEQCILVPSFSLPSLLPHCYVNSFALPCCLCHETSQPWMESTETESQNKPVLL